jgi:hypothetical protein
MRRINEVPVRGWRGTIAAMVPSHWPLADLWLQTPELVLRWPSLDRANWQATHAIPVQIHDLPPCLPLFGLPAEK